MRTVENKGIAPIPDALGRSGVRKGSANFQIFNKIGDFELFRAEEEND
jgi:hypothetical protein